MSSNSERLIETRDKELTDLKAKEGILEIQRLTAKNEFIVNKPKTIQK